MREISITHGLMEARRQAMEESRLQTVFGCLGIGKAFELRRIAQEAQEAQERAKQLNIFGVLGTAAQSSGLKMIQALAERFREAKTLGGAIPTEEEFRREVKMLNDSPVHKIYRELREHCEHVEREESEKERREGLQKILRDNQRAIEKTFTPRTPHFEVEPVTIPERKPFKMNLEINVIINPASAEGTN